MGELERLGYDDWFRGNTDDDKVATHDIARVVSVHKDSCVITKGHGNAYAEPSGSLLYAADSPLDLPTTGDWVYADFYDDDSHAIVHEVLPRKTLLKRKTAGKRVDYQLIAANIDMAFIMQSVDDNFNLRRLERYLVVVNESGITPVILLSKIDLISEKEMSSVKEQVAQIALKTRVIAFSNETGDNLEELGNSMKPGQTYCLLGSSGVGKTTLLNRILGNEQFDTQSISGKTSKGRHTTTSRELVQLENGALLIDTPGMRELGTMSADSGLDDTFTEIAELARHCQFGDCSHTAEKGCAVLTAVDQDKLSKQRYANFMKMRAESTFNQMTYCEKRKKDKAFGKMIKATLTGNQKYKA
jgi:ribosome biogenesis GTPase / thiamine phosphate phosphatase